MLLPRFGRRAFGFSAAVLLLTAFVTGCAARFPEATARRAAQASPFRGVYGLVDADSNARRTATAWRLSRPADAAALEKLASQPTAFWMGDWYPEIEVTLRQVFERAQAADVPVLVLYNLPIRDCGLYAAGGAASASSYRAWIDAVARGIGSRRAVLVLEPDGLAQMANCLDERQRERRIAMIRYAVGVLTALPASTVYVDAGHSAWVPAAEMASLLLEAGIARADGFSLNVSNYRATEEVIQYGREVSQRVGGKHFIIDTSRNGNGPPQGLGSADEGNWCNPDGRALGTPPTTRTGDPLCDAFLWIKAPGESDGPCNQGPTAGAWWPQKALEMARNAKW